jgi:hypothetical protein
LKFQSWTIVAIAIVAGHLSARVLCGSLRLACEELCKALHDSFVIARLAHAEGLPILASRCGVPAACATLLLLQLPLLGVDGQPVVFFGDLEQPLARIPIRKRFRFGAGFFRSISPVARVL